MRKSVRQLEEPTGVGALLREGIALSAAAVIRNPLAVGGTTAFLVAFSFVSANALWYQPHFHQGALFSTRAPAPAPLENGGTAANVLLREPAPAPQLLERTPAALTTDAQATESITPTPPVQPGDAMVAKVQATLKGLELYAGEVDGLAGPQTSAAVATYQKIVGLQPSGEVNDALLTQLGILQPPANEVDLQQVAALPEIAPAAPAPAPRSAAPDRVNTVAVSAPDPRVVRIQAGLRAFGNDGIELDGVVGARTRTGIEEFQSLFGLPITGEPDNAVYAKMREIGLTD
ncbi:peptidoglycan-binding protein [Mesorhizobium sp. Z1-4]|uniref:peptidoglycan-binding domain-containing protein n=1 Tax=Mesorhizobium sp. Z1-4 TaxID=2448478 RepID=UPI000FDBD808|nr:peptidoglycan-binding protein [Mesorhizobium sp. Z1-4]